MFLLAGQLCREYYSSVMDERAIAAQLKSM